jgi:acetyl esterase/lipase
MNDATRRRRSAICILAFVSAIIGALPASAEPAERPVSAPPSEGGHQTMPSHAEQKGLNVPARFIPVPTSVSPEAQAYLAKAPPVGGAAAPDPAKDPAAWRAYNAETDRRVAAMLQGNAKAHPGEIVNHQLSQFLVYEVTPKSLSARNAKRAVLWLHGGGFTLGGGIGAAYGAMPFADLAQMRVFVVDYRMPPDHNYPAPLDDTVEAYRWLLQRYKAANIGVHGGSAGGNLAAAMALRVRDEGLPMPGALVLHTPASDMTKSGDSYYTLNGIDPLLSWNTEKLGPSIYGAGHDLKDPYLSPVFGDFRKGYPPSILTTGTRDILLSSTVMLHRALRRAGIKAELNVYEAMPHGGFFASAPEDHEIDVAHAQFLDENLGTE